MANRRSQTQTRGGAETTGHIPGLYSLAVGMPPDAGPDGWTWTKLSEVARLETGHTPSRRHPEYWDGDIPWIGIRDATANHGQTLVDTNQHTNELGIEKSSARVLPKNTVCLSRTASVGYVVVMGRPMATSQDFVNWVCSERIDHQFLKYILLSENRSFASFASGTTHQTIYFPEVRGFHVCLPSIGIQRKIASILSAYDDLIENNTRRIAILEEMAQAIYREWFVNFRFPGHENVKLVDSPLGQIPEGWEVVTTRDAIEIKPRTHVPKEGEKHFVSMGAVPHNTMLIDESEIEFRTKNSGSKFRNGDTLFARITPCLENGKTAFVNFLPSDEDAACGSTEFIVLRSKTVIPEFVYLLARSDEFRDIAIKSMSGATGRQRVREACFDQFYLAHPTPTLLEQFQEVANPLFRSVFTLAKKNHNLRTTRDLLLPKLISGKLDVEDLDIDVGLTAEALEEVTA